MSFTKVIAIKYPTIFFSLNRITIANSFRFDYFGKFIYKRLTPIMVFPDTYSQGLVECLSQIKPSQIWLIGNNSILAM